MESNKHIFASGVVTPGKPEMTSLTVLMPVVTMETNTSFVCSIGVMKKGGVLKMIERFLNVSNPGNVPSSDIEKLRETKKIWRKLDLGI